MHFTYLPAFYMPAYLILLDLITLIILGTEYKYHTPSSSNSLNNGTKSKFKAQMWCKPNDLILHSTKHKIQSCSLNNGSVAGAP
jgi:hypothetical protein